MSTRIVVFPCKEDRISVGVIKPLIGGDTFYVKDIRNTPLIFIPPEFIMSRTTKKGKSEIEDFE